MRSIHGQLQVVDTPRILPGLSHVFGVSGLSAGLAWPWLGNWSLPRVVSHPPWACAGYSDGSWAGSKTEQTHTRPLDARTSRLAHHGLCPFG